MKLNPKAVLGGVLVATAVIFLLVIITKFTKPQKSSSLLLEYFENKFKLTFQITDLDKARLKAFLKNLEIDENVIQGPIFELDSTSSAKLAFQTPLKLNLDLSDKKTEFTGELNQPLFKEKIEASQIKIPKDTELAVFAPDLSEFAISKLKVSDEVKKTLSGKVKSQTGQFFLSLSSGENFALYFKNATDFEKISEIPLEATVQASTIGSGTVTIYRIKDPSLENVKIELVPVFFEQNGYKVLATSQDTAKQLLNETKSIQFPKEERAVTFALLFTPGDNFSPQDFSSIFMKNGISNVSTNEKFNKSLSQIQEAYFSLKGTAFSGLIRIE